MSSAEGEPPTTDYISTDEAFARIRLELGITKWSSFSKWREEWQIRTVNCLPRAEFEEALAKSEPRGAWRRPGRKQGEQRT